MPPQLTKQEEKETIECLTACCCILPLIAGIVSLIVIWCIMLNDNKIPEIRSACTSDLFNIMLATLMLYICVYVNAQLNIAIGVEPIRGSAHIIPVMLIAAVLKLSHARENLTNEICHNATTTKFESQSDLAGHAGLENLAIFLGSVELLGVLGFFVYVLSIRLGLDF